MNDLLASLISELESQIRLQNLLQSAHVKLKGEEDMYIKGIINGLDSALSMARDLAYLYEMRQKGEL